MDVVDICIAGVVCCFVTVADVYDDLPNLRTGRVMYAHFTRLTYSGRGENYVIAKNRKVLGGSGG